MSDGVIFWIIVIGLAVLFYAARPIAQAPSLNGTVPIAHTTAKLAAWKDFTDATDLILVVDHETGALLARYVRARDGELRFDPLNQPTLPAGEHHVDVTDTAIIALGERDDTVGAFAGYFSGELHNGHRAQFGVHYEPCGFLADTIRAPSFALSADLIGVGFTLNLPPSHFPVLSRIGLGAWECAPFDGSHPALLYGAMLRTDFP